MKWMAALILALAPAGVVIAQVNAPAAQPVRQAPVDAAVNDAISALLKDLAAYPLTEGVTVGDLLDRTAARPRMLKTLEQATQIGGPRWLSDDVAQVRMEIEGAKIAATLREIAAANPQSLPVGLTDMEPALQEMAGRTFAATGSGAAPSTVDDVKPIGMNPAWAGVDENARRAAIRGAKYDAALSVIDSVSDIRLPSGTRLGELMRQPNSPLRRKLEEHLLSRPVTAVRFADDRQVHVTLSAPPMETFEVIRAALAELPQGRDLTDAQWQSIREQFMMQISAATGQGAVPQTATVLPIQPTVQLPTQPPVWISDMIDAEGTSVAVDNRLKTTRAAELQALDKLRQQVLQLPLTPDMTIGEAATRDPALAEAVNRALERSRTYKSDYHADGRVVVRTSLELRDVWEQLSRR